MNKIQEHAKHPKASLILGCCTLCWALLGSFFLFSGGVAVYNLTVQDAYFSGPRGFGKVNGVVNKEVSSMNPVGTVKFARSATGLSSFISAADVFGRITTNTSYEVCYGGDANAGKFGHINKDTGCQTFRAPSPKCGKGETVTADWGFLKEFNADDLENYDARMATLATLKTGAIKWKNKTIADFDYRVSIASDATNAGFTLTSLFAILTGIVALLSTFNLTENRKMMLLILLFTLMASTYATYNGVGYYVIQSARASYKNCAGMQNDTYYSTREIPECRVNSDSTEYSQGIFFSATDYETYQFKCDLIENPKDNCNKFNQYCQFVNVDADAQAADSTTNTRAKVALKKDTCINKKLDGYFSYACNDAQKVFWNRKNGRCGTFKDQVPGVTVLADAKPAPCGDEMLYDKANCLQVKKSTCVMNKTAVVTGCTNATMNKRLCQNNIDFFYDFDLSYVYNTESHAQHQLAKDRYEPCSEDKTIFGNVTKAYNAYYNVPSGCITDNKGENLDTLAGAFLARAAIVDWGLSFIYVEIAFLLLTVFHAFYCTGTGKPDDENRRASDVEMPQNGAAKPNPFGPGE